MCPIRVNQSSSHLPQLSHGGFEAGFISPQSQAHVPVGYI